MVLALIKAVLGIAALLGGWLLVQLRWRRVFPGTPPDEDVLAGRPGCHGCSHPTPCDQQRDAPRERDEESMPCS